MMNDESAVEVADLVEAEAERTKIENSIKAHSRHSFVIPSCSQWFDFERIHELEQSSLPEFFC